MKTVYLHIGLQKTGTSSVQAHLMRPGGPLADAGIDYLPQAIAPAQAHHNAAWDIGGHKRYQPALPGIDALVGAINASAATRMFVSSEDFSILPPSSVAALAEKLAGITVRPILCLRNPLDWAESLYAQACKQSNPFEGAGPLYAEINQRGTPASFMIYAQRLEAGGRLAFDRILDSWCAAFGAKAMTILIYEDHADMTDAFARLLDLPPTTKVPRKNRSLNERFIIASQQIIDACKAGRLTLNGRPVLPDRAAVVSRTLLDAGRQNPAFAGSPVFLSKEAAQAFMDRMRPMTDRIAAYAALPASYRQISPARRDAGTAETADTDALIAALLATPAIQDGI